MSLTKFAGFFVKYWYDLAEAATKLQVDEIYKAAEMIRDCKGTVWLIGNGGSATLASHMATDLQLANIKAIALTDVAAITTYANDVNFMSCFTFQFAKLFQEEDILIAISGSGKSPNVVQAAYYAMTANISVIAVTGFDGGTLKENCSLHLSCPAQHMGVSQDLHQVVLHMICYYLMEGKK